MNNDIFYQHSRLIEEILERTRECDAVIYCRNKKIEIHRHMLIIKYLDHSPPLTEFKEKLGDILYYNTRPGEIYNVVYEERIFKRDGGMYSSNYWNTSQMYSERDYYNQRSKENKSFKKNKIQLNLKRIEEILSERSLRYK